jgi:hypothetical protein
MLMLRLITELMTGLMLASAERLRVGHRRKLLNVLLIVLVAHVGSLIDDSIFINVGKLLPEDTRRISASC